MSATIAKYDCIASALRALVLDILNAKWCAMQYLKVTLNF